jgi:predicted outer membrane lipoprotein
MYLWATEEIKQGSSRMYDVGKFLLTIATGTGVAFVTFSTGRSYEIDGFFVAAVSFHLLAIIAAVYAAWPRQWKTGVDSDLYIAYDREQLHSRIGLWTWLITWLLGLGLAGAFFVSRARAHSGHQDNRTNSAPALPAQPAPSPIRDEPNPKGHPYATPSHW